MGIIPYAISGVKTIKYKTFNENEPNSGSFFYFI